MRALLRSPDVPLVTLTGPGGVGKTRLALAVAHEAAADFADGVSFVSLAAIRDPHLVCFALAESLGAVDAADTTPADRLRSYLHDQELLVVLDNFEHLLDEAPLVAELLIFFPKLKMLVTSRTVLRLSDEHDFPVSPLALPDPQHLPPLADLRQTDAVALFLQRAAAAAPGFDLTDDNAQAVADICVRLDGLPLALELAAARTRVLPPRALVARLTNRLTLLTGGARDQPGRLQSMRDAIAWSYDLLSPGEQALFRRLSVFNGGFTLDAAERVVSRESWVVSNDEESPHDSQLTTHDSVLDDIASLVDQSLLSQGDRAAGEVRFAMLETVRHYGLDQLATCQEAETVQRRHADYYLAMAEATEEKLRGADQLVWLARLEAEHDNVRQALSWSIEHGEAEIALRLAGALHWFWFLHNHWSEGRLWLEAVLALAGAAPPTPHRAKALAGVGALAFPLCDYATARGRLAESIAISRELADAPGLARGLSYLGWPLFVQGEFAAMRACVEESANLCRTVGDSWGLAFALCSLGMVQVELGDDAARSSLEESFALARTLGDRWNTARILNGLGEIARVAGDDERAAALYDECITLFKRLNFPRTTALALHNLGCVTARRGGLRQAAAYFAEGFSLQAEYGDRRGMACCLVGLAGMVGRLGRPRRAARLYGAAETLIEDRGVVFTRVDRADHECLRAAVRSLLETSAFDAAYEEGRRLSNEQVIAEAGIAADEAAQSVGPVTVPAPNVAGLTDREFDVLRLLVDGHSNPDIAATLCISRRTASNHVTNILAKLGVESRTAAATLALRNGLV